VVLFPGIIIPLFVGRQGSIKAVETALMRDRRIFVVAQKNADDLDPSFDSLYEVGTLCNVIQVARISDGTNKVLVEGVARMRNEGFVKADAMRVPIAGSDADAGKLMFARLSPMPWRLSASPNMEALKRRILVAFERYNALQPRIPAEVMSSITAIDDMGKLVNLIASHISVKAEAKQTILEIADIEPAMTTLLKTLLEEIGIMELERDIQERVRTVVDKQQKEYYLREQLRVIQDELGQKHPDGLDDEELKRYAEKIAASSMSEEAAEKGARELKRLEKMPLMSPEAVVVRNYLDWLLDLPWNERTVDNADIARAEAMLNSDHYGMEEVKDRVLEFLAVRRKAGQDMKAQIICFVGPPGVGKTSLGRSIANVLGRKFANVSLGGVRDEAEIRGHRRTYIGSLPGRIIQKLARAKSRNPVILLDEIDKLGSDRGDPAAALLEVLDPEQNSAFTDHYLEIPFDLSEVLFITTANVTHSIPKPLLDRMEVINLPGYTTREKVKIAVGHLIPRVLKENGLAKSHLRIAERTIERLISGYTREAGVRGLERELGAIARKVARKVVEASDKGEKTRFPVTVGGGDLFSYLGASKVHGTKLPKRPQLGSVVGLAWTEAGGEVLMIEAATMKGKGELSLTGQLGDIMQESARAAVGYLRSNAEKLGIGSFNWKESDIHVHVPEGAVPKDGPSAGVTMATAILSAVSRRRAASDMAMTGEISLRGHVLPVGGIKEKLLAAKRYGITRVILPGDNRADVLDIKEDVLGGMELEYVSEAADVFKKALVE
jgi:ATP-dependent Lon protease